MIVGMKIQWGLHTHNYLDGKNQLIPELCAKCYADISMINTGDTLSIDFIWLNSIQ